MSENIDPRQQAIRDMVKEFAEKEIQPISAQLDQMPEPRKFPTELYKKIGQAGFIGLNIPGELGGQGKSHLEYATLIEELSFHDAAVGQLCGAGGTATFPLVHFASGQQKKKYVPDCASGKKIPAFVLSEPEAGSDTSNQSTVAVDGGDHYLVSGEKIFIMHGDVAELGVLFCRVAGEPEISAFIVDDTAQAGWQAQTLRNKLGMRAATAARIVLKDVKVPKENLLGEHGKGSLYAESTLDSIRVVVAAQGVGIAQRALNESVAYARNRQAFGQPIAKLQAIQWMIADMGTRLEAARSLTYNAAQKQDAGQPFSMEAAMARLYATETAGFCVDRAMQIHAGYGYIGEFSAIEKLYRDQPVLDIYESSADVQRLAIAGNILER
jgi:butyryl-CoA dehydrogenase